VTTDAVSALIFACLAISVDGGDSSPAVALEAVAPSETAVEDDEICREKIGADKSMGLQAVIIGNFERQCDCGRADRTEMQIWQLSAFLC